MRAHLPLANGFPCTGHPAIPPNGRELALPWISQDRQFLSSYSDCVDNPWCRSLGANPEAAGEFTGWKGRPFCRRKRTNEATVPILEWACPGEGVYSA